MQFRFSKKRFLVANLPLIITLGFSIWWFLTISNQIHIDFQEYLVNIGFNLLIKFFPILLILMYIPTVILAHQYYKHSSNIEVIFKDEYLEIRSDNLDENKVIKKSDIQKIVSVQPYVKNNRLYPKYSYLVLITEQNEVILTCFTITKRDFLDLFGNYNILVESYPFTPYIKPKNYLGINKAPELSLSALNDKPIKLSGLYFELLRILVIGGLAFYTFTAFFLGQTWFFISLLTTLTAVTLLGLHKKVYIGDNEFIIRYFNKNSTYSFNEIKTISEIQWSIILTLGLSDPLIKMGLIDKNGTSRTIFFFPRKHGYKELTKKLHLG